MKLSILGYFDIGLSVGIDDHPFDNETKIKSFEKGTGLPVTFPAFSLPVGIRLSLGRGLRVGLSNSDIVSTWQKQAQAQPKATGVDVQLLFQESRITNCYMDFYSLGIVFLRLDFDGVSSEHPDAIIDFFQCFEYAAYEHTSSKLKIIAQKFINCFEQNDNLQKISHRLNLSYSRDFDLIPGFVCVCMCENGEDRDKRDKTIQAAQEYERQYTFQRLDLDDGILHLGWAACVIEPRTDEWERIFYLLQITQVFFGICEAFEGLFTRRMSESVRRNLGDYSVIIDERILNALRTLAAAVVELTIFSSTSNNISDIYLFEAFDKLAKVSVKQDRIRASCDIFLTIQNELSRLEEARREKRLGNFVFVLTSLTFVSVLADIINTVDYVHQLIPNPFVRFVILCLPPLLVIFSIWKFAFAKRI